MEYGKFIILGEDKKSLARIKNALVANGHIFVGYSKESSNILRAIRGCTPDLTLLEVNNNFTQLKTSLEVIDEEMLTACVLILDTRNEEVFDFLKKTRVVTYVMKPVFDEVILQTVDMSLIYFDRMVEYERKVKKLNDTIESRRIIEKAKWILVEQEGITESEAYDRIQKKSRDNRMPMRNIAEAILLTRG